MYIHQGKCDSCGKVKKDVVELKRGTKSYVFCLDCLFSTLEDHDIEYHGGRLARNE